MITEKNIVLTGCNSGIGLEVLKMLLRGNNKIFCVDYEIDKLKDMASDKLFVFEKDVSSKEAVDEIFEKALDFLGNIDIFYANAGYAYYEEMNYTDWDRVQKIFETNVFSPIYSYQKYVEYLNGRKGVFAVTISAIGTMAMPGFTLYSASKYALNGFREGIRFEKPDNVQLTCLYPIATDTGFFKRSNDIKYKRPFPVQSPVIVAKKMIEGIESGKSDVNPSALFVLSKQLMKFIPPVKSAYLFFEKKKFEDFKKKVKELSNK